MKLEIPFIWIPLLLLAVAVTSANGQHDFHSFHGGTGEAKLDYDSLASAAVPIEDSAEGKALAEACLARYGGAEKLTGLEGFRLVYLMRGSGPDTTVVTRTFQRDRRHRFRKNDETRIFNGTEAWHRKGDDWRP